MGCRNGYVKVDNVRCADSLWTQCCQLGVTGKRFVTDQNRRMLLEQFVGAVCGLPLFASMWGASHLDRNPLDLIECDLIACAVVELGSAWAFMYGHGLRVLECAAGF